MNAARSLAGAILAALMMAGCSGSSGTSASATMPTAPTAPAPDTPPPGPQPAPAPTPVPATARYRVTFQATWSAATHPTDAPGNPHFSPPIGGTHNGSVRFWREGGLATEGIERMAELGSPRTLEDEIRAAIAAGTAEHVVQAGGIGSPGSVDLEFEISRDFSLVTLVSMVAPSPDWFVGVSSLALFQNGDWVQERTIELVPWDAGSDSGVSFESPDEDTVPHGPISRIVEPPLASPSGQVVPMGTFTFRRIG